MNLLAVELHPEAMAEASVVRERYQDRSAEAARAFFHELDVGIDSIRATPDLYPAYISRPRRYLMRRFPHLIVYRVLPAAIQVIAIAHGRRRPGYWKSLTVG